LPQTARIKHWLTFLAIGECRSMVRDRSPKSATSRRTVPLSATTAQALREWRLAQPPGRSLVFGTGSDRPDTPSNLLDPLQVKAVVLGKDGRPKYSWHALRHYAISAWLRTCNGDFQVVRTRAGHSSLVMTMDVYGHLLAPQDRDQGPDAERGLFG
jgi:integrase